MNNTTQFLVLFNYSDLKNKLYYALFLKSYEGIID